MLQAMRFSGYSQLFQNSLSGLPTAYRTLFGITSTVMGLKALLLRMTRSCGVSEGPATGRGRCCFLLPVLGIGCRWNCGGSTAETLIHTTNISLALDHTPGIPSICLYSTSSHLPTPPKYTTPLHSSGSPSPPSPTSSCEEPRIKIL